MAMSVGRMIMYLVGTILVIAAIAMFFFQTGLNRWVPTTLLVAGIILIIGLAVMGFANAAPEERRTRYIEDDRREDVIIRK